jgi:hypothetical protein
MKTKLPRHAIIPPPGSALTPSEFEDACIAIFGKVGWQKTFARGTGISPSTLTRYLQGIFPVPVTIALIVEMLATLKRNGFTLPQRFSAVDEPTEGNTN